MPIQLIRTLHRPLPERILISCLMAMGLLATTIAAIKMTTFKGAFLGDPLSSTVIGSLWAKLEEQVGIIAACMPCLKGPAERILRRVGILATNFGQSIELPSFVVPQSRKSAPPQAVRRQAGYDEAIPENGDVRVNSSTISAWTGTTMDPKTIVDNASGSMRMERTISGPWEYV
ncbi:uncharacterized protein PAC_04608 [Phialocephala subalpina]|uniref:Rhodopsin domain-containing protein n=1 Tax=Phialocephala subalpina TaxID=576137 RepID=A0A1L7WPM5_9HELO|nr:uncharacterized protein PAC_04608 [Phialocephala subalpina]